MKSFVAVLLLALCAVASAEEEKNIEKRGIYYGSYVYPYRSYIPYFSGPYKRDTTAVEKDAETEKNVDKRAVVIGSPLVYPYAAYNTWPYGIFKRETEEGVPHTVEKREVTEEGSNNQQKRDLILGYEYPYYTNYAEYGYPGLRYWL